MKAAVTLCFAFLAATLCAQRVAAAENPADTIVYIECMSGGLTSSGSGVVVSSKGHVLTARHVLERKDSNGKPVIPADLTCTGSIGGMDQADRRNLILQPTPGIAVDAAVLKFQKSGTYDFMKVCPLEDWMVRRKIFAAGFPVKTETGVPSFREGILSTLSTTSKGVLETDSQTIQGMSGGPVFSENLRGLVGIVVGAQFTAEGTVSFYGILRLDDQLLTGPLGLIIDDQPCYRQTRQIDLPEDALKWVAGDGEKVIAVNPDEGFCYLVKVWGQFNASSDQVSIEPRDDHYVITGGDGGGGQHGASVKCVRFN